MKTVRIVIAIILCYTLRKAAVKSSPNDNQSDGIRINEPLLFIEGKFEIVRVFDRSSLIGIYLLAELSNSVRERSKTDYLQYLGFFFIRM